MNGNELLLAFAEIDERQVAEAADTAAARQIFRRYQTRRNKTIAAVFCCLVAVLAAAGVGYRSLLKKIPMVPRKETGNAGQVSPGRSDPVPTSGIADISTTIESAGIPSASSEAAKDSTEPTSTGASSPIAAATEPAPATGSRSDPEITGDSDPGEPSNAAVPSSSGQTPTDLRPQQTLTAPTTDPRATSPTTARTPDEKPGAQPTAIGPNASLTPTGSPTPGQPSSSVPVDVPLSSEAIVFEQYVYRLKAPEYASYLSGKVIDGSRVGEKIADSTASAGWRYADGSMPVVEILRCELYEIRGIDRTVAVCVRFIDKGEALTTDRFYALIDPNAGLSSVSEFLIPTTLPNDEE